jgi:hypothetical protein
MKVSVLERERERERERAKTVPSSAKMPNKFKIHQFSLYHIFGKSQA